MINTLVLFVLVFGGIVLADSNGVWHKAEDVQGGTFGNDEQDVSASIGYTFKNKLTLQNDLLLTSPSLLNCNGKLITDSTGKVSCGVDSGGVVSPPVCTGDSALQWTGSAWGCKSFTPSAPACTSTCTFGQLTCGGTGTNYIISCESDGTGCYKWSSGGTYCSYGCSGGVCNSAPVVTPTPTTYTYMWEVGGSCSVTCGTGIKTVTCKRSDNTLADPESLCTTPKPSNVCTNPICAPTVGGEWVLVPGNSALGTSDFYVMKYEAKQVNGLATSQPLLIPWGSITKTDAITECTKLGASYDLPTNAEWTSIARNVELVPSNWNTGTVGSGYIYKGHSAVDINVYPNGNFLQVTDVNNWYSGTGYSATYGPSQRRVLTLSNGQIIWDLSGNKWEWVKDTCTKGIGANNWFDTTTSGWLEWGNSNLNDYERGVAGPSVSTYTSANAVGKYYGCTSNGYNIIRGGRDTGSAMTGIYAIAANQATTAAIPQTGFRCVYRG